MVSKYTDPWVLGCHSLVSEYRFAITQGLMGIVVFLLIYIYIYID